MNALLPTPIKRLLYKKFIGVRLLRLCPCGEIGFRRNKCCSNKCWRRWNARSRSVKPGSLDAIKLDAVKRIGKLATGTRERSEMHPNAKPFKYISPAGLVFRFRNLRHFIRTHTDLFAPEDAVWSLPKNPKSKMDLRCAAEMGLRSIKPGPRAKRKAGIWKGWVWAKRTYDI